MIDECDGDSGKSGVFVGERELSLKEWNSIREQFNTRDVGASVRVAEALVNLGSGIFDFAKLSYLNKKNKLLSENAFDAASIDLIEDERKLQSLIDNCRDFFHTDEFPILIDDDEKMKEIMQRGKSASEYLYYTRAVIRVYDNSTAGHPIKDNFRLLRKGPGKKLEDEMKPLAYFSNLYYDAEADKVCLSLVLSNKNYDALVKDERSKKENIDYIEITCIENGREEHANRVDLSQAGVSSRGRNAQEIVDEQRELLKEAVKKKLCIKYNKNTALLIYVSNPWWNSELAGHICSVLPEIDGLNDGFSLICCFNKDQVFYLQKFD